MHAPGPRSVFENDVEAARNCNEYLCAAFQRMTGACSAAGDVVEIEHALDVEGDVLAAFEKSEISPRIGNFGKFQQSAVSDRGAFHGQQSNIPGLAAPQAFECS